MLVSMVVPARNCADVLAANVRKIDEELGKTCKHEIIIAEDGSSDSTGEVASKLARTASNVRCITSERRKGKGGALKDAFMLARGDVLAFIDADLSPDVSCFPKLLGELDNGTDVAIGSRKVKGAESDRNYVRDVFSFAYNSMVRVMFGTGIRDIQCGFKAFRRDALPAALAAESDGFIWDTEFIVLARKKRLRIKEVPIRWRESKSKTQMKLARDTIRMFVSLLELKMRLI